MASGLNSVVSIILLLFVTTIAGTEDAGIFSLGFSTAQMMLCIGNYGMRNFQSTDIKDKYTFGTYLGSRILTNRIEMIIMAVLVIASIILVRNLKVENPGKVQLALEAGIGAAEDYFVGVLGKENKGYVPYLITVLLYLACSNTIAPLFGFKPPTKDLNVTAALAIMSMCLIEFSGIRKNGFGHWAKV